MIDSVYLAWHYLAFNKARAATLITCVTLLLALPLSLQRLMSHSEQALRARADATPLLLGARGSALDLVLNALYFGAQEPEPVTMAAVDAIDASGLALSIPLLAGFEARGFPIVGTTLDYFDFRGLTIARGRQLALLGEAVVGAEVADRLGLQPGDGLVSAPRAVFDLAGVYPLKLQVVGVLAPSRSPDDRAVLVDLNTAWVVQGLIHGHGDLSRSADASLVIARSGGQVMASAKVVEYTEITDDNRASFHLHGDPAGYPLTAVLAVPDDTKSGTLLRGRYVDAAAPYQLVVPGAVIDGLLADIFRIKRVLDLVTLVVGFAALLALGLVFALSLRLRQRETQTVFRLGGSRLTIARLLTAEIAIILAASVLLCLPLLWGIDRFGGALVRQVLIS